MIAMSRMRAEDLRIAHVSGFALASAPPTPSLSPALAAAALAAALAAFASRLLAAPSRCGRTWGECACAGRKLRGPPASCLLQHVPSAAHSARVWRVPCGRTLASTTALARDITTAMKATATSWICECRCI